MRRLALIVVVLGAVLGGIAYASIPGPDGVIHACYKPSDGKPVLVDHDEACGSGETRLTWNQTGPQGASGPEGAQGEQGLQGETGAPGASGTVGLWGLIDSTEEIVSGSGIVSVVRDTVNARYLLTLSEPIDNCAAVVSGSGKTTPIEVDGHAELPTAVLEVNSIGMFERFSILVIC